MIIVNINMSKNFFKIGVYEYNPLTRQLKQQKSWEVDPNLSWLTQENKYAFHIRDRDR